MHHICSFPSELLFEIFTYAIFDPRHPTDPVRIDHRLVHIYSSLHKLIAVCSVWRDVILSRSSLWSIVPVVEPWLLGIEVCDKSKLPLSTDLSLQRSGNTILDLVAISYSPRITTELINHAHRFRSINILAKSERAIKSFMSNFLESDSPLRVSDLSICFGAYYPLDRIPVQRDYYFPPDPPQQTAFRKLVKALSVLRISGVMINWDGMVFSHRLVEIELQNVTLGYDSKLREFITSLSAATELRSLRLISIQTFPDPPTTQNATIIPSVSFPKLQTLLARNLYYNTLNTLLSHIASRSQGLTLHPTARTFQILEREEQEHQETAAQNVLDLFNQVTVDTLLLEAYEEEGPWLAPEDIWEVLHSIPGLKPLRMHSWDFGTEFCEAIHQIGTPDFPQLEYIYLSGARIRDEKAFKNMVASYSKSLEHMELAGSAVDGSADGLLTAT